MNEPIEWPNSAAFVTSGHDKRQVRMIVHRRVPKAAADNVDRMIQERAVAIRCGFHFAVSIKALS